eukprot:6754432-Prymnesium_polylepis.1
MSDGRRTTVDAIAIWQEPRHEEARRAAAGVDLDLCYNPSNERLHNAGRVDDGKRARPLHIPFFGHGPRRAHDSHLQFALRCVPARPLAFTVAS